MSITVDGLKVSIGDIGILEGVHAEVAGGSFHGVIGPNGSGKSTLLRCIYRALKPTEGRVLLDGEDLWQDLSARQAALKRAVVAQDNTLDLDFAVRDVVAMGRAPHKRLFERDTAADAAFVNEALGTVGMGWAADRLFSTLSGGERQRVLLARSLAQQAPILVLDEPTNHLDVRAQVELLAVVCDLGLTTIAALHDLGHAAAVCDKVTVLRKGSVVASGTPEDVLTTELIRDVFGVDAHIGTHPLTGRLHIAVAPLSRP